MNPNLCRVVLRPRGPLEVFDLTVRFLREHASAFLVLIAVLLIVPGAVLGVASWLSGGHAALLVAPVLLAPFLQAPATVLAGRLLFAERVPWRDVVRDVWTRLGSLVASWIVLGIGVLFGCGVATPLTMAACAYVTEAALLERVDAGHGFRRSLRLAGSNPGIALAVSVGWFGLTAWCAAVGEAFGQQLFSSVLQLGQPFGTALDGQVTPFLLLGALTAQPLHAVYRLLLYIDARTRFEGWDLQVGLRAAGLGALS